MQRLCELFLGHKGVATELQSSGLDPCQPLDPPDCGVWQKNSLRQLVRLRCGWSSFNAVLTHFCGAKLPENHYDDERLTIRVGRKGEPQSCSLVTRWRLEQLLGELCAKYSLRQKQSFFSLLFFVPHRARGNVPVMPAEKRTENWRVMIGALEIYIKQVCNGLLKSLLSRPKVHTSSWGRYNISQALRPSKLSIKCSANSSSCGQKHIECLLRQRWVGDDVKNWRNVFAQGPGHQIQQQVDCQLRLN